MTRRSVFASLAAALAAIATFRPLSALKRPPHYTPSPCYRGTHHLAAGRDRADRRVAARLVSPRTAAGQVRRGGANHASLQALEVRDAPAGAGLLLGCRTGAWFKAPASWRPPSSSTTPATGNSPPRRPTGSPTCSNEIGTLRWQMSRAWIDQWLAEQQRRREAGRLRCHGDGRHSFPIW